jgi:two-component system, OmpR family, sensor histidine kinase KdpD
MSGTSNPSMSENGLAGGLALALLYEFTRDLADAGEMDAILQAIVRHIGRTFGRPVVILLPGGDGEPAVAAASPGFLLAEDERRAAGQALCQEPQPAGDGGRWRNGNLWLRASLWRPMCTPRGVVGVLGLAAGRKAGRAQARRGEAAMPATSGESALAYPRLTAGRLRLLEVFAGSGALAIERARFAEHAQQIQVLQATEKLQSALLHSISHDLRTPLLAITVAFSNLEMADARLDEATRRALARTGRQEAERLDRLVGNLLNISRIEAGALKLALEPCDVEEAIGAALDRLAPETEERPASIATVDERAVSVEMPLDLAPVPMDQALIVQALVNVLDNAVKYSPDGTQVDIIARPVDEWLWIQVADNGPGIPAGEIEHIFDRFYRVEGTGDTHGTGLGLAISKGIVEAHGGRIWAEARPGGGTVVTIALPLAGPLPESPLSQLRPATGEDEAPGQVEGLTGDPQAPAEAEDGG